MHRIQKHFHPLTSRAVFSPERQLTPPPTTTRTSFPLTVPCLVPAVTEIDLTVDEPADEPAISAPIPKPTGNNFDLKAATMLSNNIFVDIQSSVNALVEEHLNTTVPFSQQQEAKLNTVHSIASNTFPQLAAFQAEWVTTELIKIELRRTVQKFSRKKTRARKVPNVRSFH
ncbi:hypothetical protein Hypma_005643 [Hypsizygus marmoreus]|uniref:Uncharacterized protein n=1 Tax=Hypsizygus marmoreus TaxID=39966 RepID=A0A369K6K8_HYPMA|nr:hypothetical protein Hypma_005643 [Hypsizygus marmoreus]